MFETHVCSPVSISHLTVTPVHPWGVVIYNISDIHVSFQHSLFLVPAARASCMSLHPLCLQHIFLSVSLHHVNHHVLQPLLHEAKIFPQLSASLPQSDLSTTLQ